MEREVGDVFNWNGKEIIVCEGNGKWEDDCENCPFSRFYTNVGCEAFKGIRGLCLNCKRSDKKSITFKELKKEKDNKMINSEDYLKTHKNSDIKVGDKVKILRKAKSFEQGWCSSWMLEMNNLIGSIYTVEGDLGAIGFNIKYNYNCYTVPWFILEVVEKKKDCPINIDDLDFGCLNKDKEVIENVIHEYLINGNLNSHELDKLPKKYVELMEYVLIFLNKSYKTNINEKYFHNIISLMKRMHKYKLKNSGD